MRFLDWLFDRKRTCADCSLYERQVECLHDGIMEERRAKWAAQEGAERSESLQAECDGLMRELWLERRRVEELKQRIALTDANVKCCFAAMALQQKHTREWCDRLIKDIQKERQRRIEAEADRDMARRQCQETAEELATVKFQIGEWKQEAALRGERIAELETLTQKGPAS